MHLKEPYISGKVSSVVPATKSIIDSFKQFCIGSLYRNIPLIFGFFFKAPFLTLFFLQLMIFPVILSVILLFMLRILFLSMCNQIFIWDISCYWFLHLNVTYRAPWTKVKRGLLEFITPKSWVISFDCSSGIDVKMDESNFRGEFRVKFQGQISMWAFKFPSAQINGFNGVSWGTY